MSNASIADTFDLLAKIMDIHGENSFKTKSYSSAAFRLEKLPEPLEEMSQEQINSISGIGEAITKKINEILTTGKLALLEEYIIKTPPGVIDMLSIKGIGPKKISLLWKELGIESIGELEYACNENRLVALKGFGAKTQESILNSIAFIHNNQGFYLWAEVDGIASQIQQELSAQFPENRALPAGHYLRQLPTLQSIEFATDISLEALKEYFGKNEQAVIGQEGDILNIAVQGSPTLQFYSCNIANLHTTVFSKSASIEFLEAFHQRHNLPEAIATEEEIFTSNNIAYIPACLRETATILERAVTKNIPELIQVQDIKGIIHAHSTWSDGIHTLEAMAKAAQTKGFEYLVISDHSQTAVYAGGLKPEQIIAQHKEIDELNQQLAPFKIFKSIESDILGDGSLDYTPEVLASFDLVIASVHSNLKMKEEKAMQRLLAAIQNPYTTILGHPTGRLLLSRDGYPVNYKELIDACVECKVVIEINAHPRRLDLDWTWIDYALDKGAMLSIDPDAHSIEGMDVIRYGIMAAQKGGLTKMHNLSSMSLAEIETFVATQKRTLQPSL